MFHYVCVCVKQRRNIRVRFFTQKNYTLNKNWGDFFMLQSCQNREKLESGGDLRCLKVGHETKKERDIALAPSGSNPFCFLHSTDRNGRNTFWRDRIFVCSMQTSSDIVARSKEPIVLAKTLSKV